VPFTTPPTFTSGQILNASQLNILSQDIAYLWGIARGPNIPWPRVGGASVVGTWLIRHRCRYLKAQVAWDKGTDPGAAFTLTIQYNNVTVQTDTFTGAGVRNYSIDLNPQNLTVGNFYQISINAFTNSFMGTYIYLNHLYEAD
jgi:hypothetical protein